MTSHVIASTIALAVLVLASALIFLAAATNLDTKLPVGALASRTVLVFLAAWAWIPAAAALTALLRRPMFSIPVALFLLMLPGPGRFNLDIPARASASMLSPLDPWSFADPRSWYAGVPLASISAAAALALAGMLALAYLVERAEM